MARYTAELLAKEMADALGETGLKLDGDGPSDAAIGLEEYDLATDAAVKMCTLGAKSALMKKPRSDDDDDDDEDDVASDILSFPVAAFDVARTILNFSIISCPASGLNKMINLVSTSDLVLSIFGRVEGSPTTGQVSASTELKSSQLLKIADGTFARDGILMHPKTIIGPLIQFALGEMKRRNSYFGSSSDVDKAGDITQLSNVLQRAENHLLSNRVLLSTWSSDSQKAQVYLISITVLN